MKVKYFLMLMLMVLFVSFSCNAYVSGDNMKTDAQNDQGQNQILTGDSSATKQVEANKEFTIDIQCNLTTGYDVIVTYFPAAVQLIKFTQDASRERGMVGAPATCHYTFKLLQPVGTKIFFTYVRPFNYEKGGTLEYDITVK